MSWYQDVYLKSEHWQVLRAEALIWAGYRCQVCNGEEELHVHHRTYDNLGHEAAADVTVAATVQLTISGHPPRTKKNHNQLVTHSGKVRVLPSKQWREWLRDAVVKCESGTLLTMEHGILCRNGRTFTMWTPLDYPMNVRAIFYRDRLSGDFIGYAQGLADLLEKRRIIVNDSLLVSWDGSRLALDRRNPRVEIGLEPVGKVGRDD